MSTTEVNELNTYRHLCQCLAVVKHRHDGSADATDAVRVWTALCQWTRNQLVQRGVSEGAIAQVEREVQRG